MMPSLHCRMTTNMLSQATALSKCLSTLTAWKKASRQNGYDHVQLSDCVYQIFFRIEYTRKASRQNGHEHVEPSYLPM